MWLTKSAEITIGRSAVGDAPATSKARFPRPLVIVGIGAAIVLLVILVAGAQLFWARRHLSAGAGELSAAIATVRSPAALNNPITRAAATADLTKARREFSSARGDLTLWSPILSGLGWVPHYGQELKAAWPAATSAYFATSSALDIVNGASGLWPLLGHHHRGHMSLLRRLEVGLSPGRQDFLNGASEATQGVSAARSLPIQTGSVTLDRAARKLRRDLPRLQAVGTWLAVMPSVLGANRSRRYLFCWENSAEIRAVGGFIGAADVVTVRRGQLSKHFTGSALSHEITFLHEPAPEAALTRETSWLFRDSNISPDFPTSARLERWFYGRDTGIWADGVIDFVDQGVPDVLRATGPVYLKQYHVTVTVDDAVRLANHYASTNSTGYRGPQSYRPGANLDTYRKQFLGYEFTAILHRLQTLPPSQWAKVGTAMTTAIRRHDILLWDGNPKIEAAIQAAGDAGQLRPSPGDFLYVVDDNRSYNKIGPYVQEQASYSVDILPNLWLDSTVKIHYHLAPSPPTLEGQGPNFIASKKHDFRDFLRVFVPAGAVVQRTAGLRLITQYVSQPAYGLTQVSGWFQMSPGQSRTITIQYQMPANVLSFDSFARYQLTVPRQPGTRLRGVSVAIAGVDGVGLATPTSSNEPLYRRWLSLSHDQRLAVGLHGRHQAPDLIPVSSAASRDPYVPWKWLRGL